MKTRIAAIATAAVLVIGGGTAYALTSNDQPEPIETVTSTTAPTDTTTPEATAESEPIVAESETKTLVDVDAEAAYLLDVRARLARIESQIPNVTDEQLLDAGHTACARMAAGEYGDDVSLIEGETRSVHGYFMDSGAIMVAASMSLCPPSS